MKKIIEEMKEIKGNFNYEGEKFTEWLEENQGSETAEDFKTWYIDQEQILTNGHFAGATDIEEFTEVFIENEEEKKNFVLYVDLFKNATIEQLEEVGKINIDNIDNDLCQLMGVLEKYFNIKTELKDLIGGRFLIKIDTEKERLFELIEKNMLTSEELGEAIDNDHITNWEHNGSSGRHSGCNWYSIETADGETFDIYEKTTI